MTDGFRSVPGRRERPVVVAIDGPSGAGKSTLAVELAARVPVVLVHGDDFYRDVSDEERGWWTSAEGASRFFDWRRMRREVLVPLRAGRPATYRAFDWDRGRGLTASSVGVEPAPVVVVEGVLTARPELADLIDLAVLVETPLEVRQRRRTARHAPDPWMARWDEAERWYFERVRPPASFDIVVDGNTPLWRASTT